MPKSHFPIHSPLTTLRQAQSDRLRVRDTTFLELNLEPLSLSLSLSLSLEQLIPRNADENKDEANQVKATKLAVLFVRLGSLRARKADSNEYNSNDHRKWVFQNAKSYSGICHSCSKIFQLTERKSREVDGHSNHQLKVNSDQGIKGELPISFSKSFLRSCRHEEFDNRNDEKDQSNICQCPV